MVRDLVPNPSAVASIGRFEPPSAEPLGFHRRLPGYARTPLVRLPELAERLGLGRLWAKDESMRLGLPSFKLLGASWAVYRALSEHTGRSLEPWDGLEELAATLAPYRPLALATATDGNHGRAVARMGRLLGLEARIFVPEGTAPARIAAIESEGASCAVVPGSYARAVERAAGEAGPRCLVISDTAWAGYESVPAWVLEGYATLFWEVDEALGEAGEAGPDLVVVPIGVGGLGAAAVRHYRRPGVAPPAAILGVEPLAAACVLASVRAGRIVSVPGPHRSIMAGLNCDTPSLVAWPFMTAGIDLFVAISDQRAAAAMRDLAAAGVVAGETGAAALAGLEEILGEPDHRTWRDQLGLGPGASVLVICTEGATDPAAYRAIVGRDPEEMAAGRGPDPAVPTASTSGS